MRTYEETIRREAEIAHSAGYMGESTTPHYARVRMVAEIYGVSATKVKREIEEAVRVLTYGPELAKEVAAASEEYHAKLREEGPFIERKSSSTVIRLQLKCSMQECERLGLVSNVVF